MEKERFVLLKAEVKCQMDVVEEEYREIEKRIEKAEESQEVLESLAYRLHNLYCAFEDMFETIASFFENEIDERSRYHKHLLLRMSINIEGVRPNVISKESFLLLDEMRAFRHLFRHAYGYRIEREKVKMVLAKALRLRGIFQDEIERFLKKVAII